jgi:hypothetical protein
VIAFGRRIKVHRLQLKDPRRLPYAARNFLIQDEGNGEADLSLYLEDDLVIHDQYYIDKLIWFFSRTDHRYGLMPHRYELTGAVECPRFFVDGPIAESAFPKHHRPAEAVASGQFGGGPTVYFDVASNPHAGTFSLSSVQRDRLLNEGSSEEGFVGPLETVATYTILEYFPVLKPSWPSRDFLLVEHAHPSFLHWRSRLPLLDGKPSPTGG